MANEIRRCAICGHRADQHLTIAVTLVAPLVCTCPKGERPEPCPRKGALSDCWRAAGRVFVVIENDSESSSVEGLFTDDAQAQAFAKEVGSGAEVHPFILNSEVGKVRRKFVTCKMELLSASYEEGIGGSRLAFLTDTEIDSVTGKKPEIMPGPPERRLVFRFIQCCSYAGYEDAHRRAWEAREQILKWLGGSANLEELSICSTSYYLRIKDISKVDPCITTP